MKKIIVFIAAMIVGFAAFCQPKGNTRLSGNVVDSLVRKPLEYATITLFVSGNSKAINGTVTDKSGNFSINDIADGNYRILVEFLGYKAVSFNNVIIGKGNVSADLKRIALAPVKASMEAVTVTASAKLIENKIDKLVYNAEKDITSQSGVASDILKKVPQVSVDVDGNVQLAGSSGVRFLINGKPSTAFGSNVAEVLQSIPASQIKSIEVITNPGAKYDAQGIGGIINIILKSSKAKGYNGNLSLTAGTRNENGNFNLNVRNNNFGANAFVGFNKRLRVATKYNYDRIANNGSVVSELFQQGNGNVERHGIQTGAGFDWTYKKYNNLSGSISFNKFGNAPNTMLTQQYQANKNNPVPAVVSSLNTHSESKFDNADAGLNYKRTFSKEDQELNIGFNTSSGKSRTQSSNEQFLLPQDSLYYGTKSLNPGKEHETELTADYNQPLANDVMLGVGGKASWYNINSSTDISSYKTLSKQYVADTSLNNDLNYKQKVLALYSEISFPVAKLFDAKVGGRYERTDINSYYSNAQQQVKVPGYNTFVPSIYLSKKLAASQTIKLSYSKRIERPDYEDLNPYVNINDPKNLSTGNPNLKPEIGNRVELGYSKDFGKIGSIMLNLFYRINDQDIQPYVIYYPTYKVGDSTFQNVSVSTRQNIGMEKNMGLNIFGDLHPSTKLSLRGNIFLFRRHTINILDAGYNSNSFNYRFNINSTYQFSGKLVAEFFGNFSSARHEAQGTYPSFTTYSFAIRQQFWNKKGSLALTANNFLSNTQRQESKLFGPGFTTTNERLIPLRSIALNFTWKFGRLEFKKEKEERDTNPNSPGE